MQLVDSHCHIHSADYPLPVAEVEARAAAAGVAHMICVGTDIADSERALAFAQKRPHVWASIGVHPHEAGEKLSEQLQNLLVQDKAGSGEAASEATPFPSAVREALFEHRKVSGGEARGVATAGKRAKIVAIGECGLDYFYSHSSKADQENALRVQIELALEHKLPLIFHVRDAFADFWPIFDSYPNLRGVLHSFTDNQANLDRAIERGLYVGINGIVTFTKNDWQLEVAKTIPANKILLETDAPFLTPKPFRGTVNEPAHVALVATFLAALRGESVEALATSSTNNALQLFSL